MRIRSENQHLCRFHQLPPPACRYRNSPQIPASINQASLSLTTMSEGVIYKRGRDRGTYRHRSAIPGENLLPIISLVTGRGEVGIFNLDIG